MPEYEVYADEHDGSNYSAMEEESEDDTTPWGDVAESYNGVQLLLSGTGGRAGQLRHEHTRLAVEEDGPEERDGLVNGKGSLL